MSTFTASELTSTDKSIHVGLISKSAVVTSSATGTASSVFKLCKIPNGATIVDYVWWVDDGGATQTYKLGVRYPEGSSSYTVTESALHGEIGWTSTNSSLSGVVVPVNRIFPDSKLPYKFSFSQGNGRETYGWIEAVAVTAISASAVHKFTAIYTMDGS